MDKTSEVQRRLYGNDDAIFPYKYDFMQLGTCFFLCQIIKYTMGTVENRALPSMNGGEGSLEITHTVFSRLLSLFRDLPNTFLDLRNS